MNKVEKQMLRNQIAILSLLEYFLLCEKRRQDTDDDSELVSTLRQFVDLTQKDNKNLLEIEKELPIHE